MSWYVKVCIFVWVFLALAGALGAQTLVTVGPVALTTKAAWETTDVTSIAQAQSFETRFRIDGATAPIVLAPVTCRTPDVPAVNTFTCEAFLNATMVAALNIAGTHSVTMRLFDPSTNLEGPDAVPFVLRSSPAAPTGLRIIR